MDVTRMHTDTLLEARVLAEDELRRRGMLTETRGVHSESRTAEDIAFTNYLRFGEMSPLLRREGGVSRAEQRDVLDANSLSTAPNTSFSAGSTGYSAGYMIPQGFWQNLQVALRQYGGIMADYRTVDTPDRGNPMPWPTIDPTSVVGYYLGEGSQTTFGGGQNSSGDGVDYEFGQGVLNCWTAVSGVILASQQLIEDSAFDVDSFCTARMAEALGRKLAAEAVTGSGTNSALGISTALAARTASTYGTPSAGAAVATSSGYSGGVYTAKAGTVPIIGGGTAGLPKLANALPAAVDLLNMVASVDPAYRNCADGTAAKFYVADSTLNSIRLLADNYGRPLLSDPSEPGNPTLWGYEVVVDNNVGAISTTASTVGGIVFGNMSHAMVYRRGPASVMRLNERYADYLQVGFLGYQRFDVRSNDLRAAVIYQSPAS